MMKWSVMPKIYAALMTRDQIGKQVKILGKWSKYYHYQCIAFIHLHINAQASIHIVFTATAVAQTGDTVCLPSASDTQPDIQEQLVTKEIIGQVLKERNQTTV